MIKTSTKVWLALADILLIGLGIISTGISYLVASAALTVSRST